MKWFAQYILSPLLAACIAIWGNYQFIFKEEMKKEYTKLGVDIMLQEHASESVKTLGTMLIDQNSPVRLSSAEKDTKIRNLMGNIPYERRIEEGITWGDITARYMVLAEWAEKVYGVCPECINQSLFNSRYAEMKRKLHAGTGSEKVSTER